MRHVSSFLVLVEHLDKTINGCNNTLRLTRDWLATQSAEHPIEEILLWLGSQGGGCDCEVAANLYDRLEIPSPAAAPSPPKKETETSSKVFG